MPWLHKYIGNPVLTWILKVLFKVNVRDAHCGMRAITRQAYEKLCLQTTGMEFASEMITSIFLIGKFWSRIAFNNNWIVFSSLKQGMIMESVRWFMINGAVQLPEGGRLRTRKGQPTLWELRAKSAAKKWQRRSAAEPQRRS